MSNYTKAEPMMVIFDQSDSVEEYAIRDTSITKIKVAISQIM